MRIVVIEHARQRMEERGIDIEELRSVLDEKNFTTSHSGRKIKEKVFSYNSEWLGEQYPEKKVGVIYVEEGDITIVLTAVAFYGAWS